MLTGDFAALAAWQAQVEQLETLPRRTAAAVAPHVEQAVKAQLAPGMGNGWAPHLTARPSAAGVAFDPGHPSRLPIGVPAPPSALQLVDAAARGEFTRTMGGT